VPRPYSFFFSHFHLKHFWPLSASLILFLALRAAILPAFPLRGAEFVPFLQLKLRIIQFSSVLVRKIYFYVKVLRIFSAARRHQLAQGMCCVAFSASKSNLDFQCLNFFLPAARRCEYGVASMVLIPYLEVLSICSPAATGCNSRGVFNQNKSNLEFKSSVFRTQLNDPTSRLVPFDTVGGT
jgi:hypothetical protein